MKLISILDRWLRRLNRKLPSPDDCGLADARDEFMLLHLIDAADRPRFHISPSRARIG